MENHPPPKPTTVKKIAATEFAKQFLDGGQPDVIDVRTQAEFRGLYLPGTLCAPMHELDADKLRAERAGKIDRPLFVLCERGGRSQRAAEQLAQAGVPDVVYVEGGIIACREAGLPVIKGENVISIERQVRIIAGALVFSGTVLGVLVHPGFLILPGFIGAGLLFAGITDTCGMAMLLARMPWNR